jgi:hypothetical protein
MSAFLYRLAALSVLASSGAWAQSGTQSGNPRYALPPAQALAAFERYCMGTNAEAAKLVPLLDALDISPMDKVVENAGNEIHMDLRVSPSLQLDVVFEPGERVLRCFLRLGLTDVPVTASLFGRKFGVSGKWEDLPPGEKSVPVTLFNGLNASFGYVKDTKSPLGSLTIFVTPKVPIPD